MTAFFLSIVVRIALNILLESFVMSLSIIILAAGKGTRMRSATTKVMHKLADRSLLEHVIDTAQALSPQSMGIV